MLINQSVINTDTNTYCVMDFEGDEIPEPFKAATEQDLLNKAKTDKIEQIKCQLALIDNNSNSRRSYREAVINKEITVNETELTALTTIENEAIALRQEIS